MRSNRGHFNCLSLLCVQVLLQVGSGHGQDFDGPGPPPEVYPDLCPVKSVLYDVYHWYTDTATYLRLTNGIANVGPWELYLEPSGPVNPETGRRPARQRVGWILEPGDTTWKYYPAGEFEYHDAPCHSHIHLGSIAQYSIREHVSDTVAGATVAVGDKVGFCLVDLVRYQADACCGPVPPGAPSAAVFQGCASIITNPFHEGISKGWSDIYRLYLTDQWVKLPNMQQPGKYWLQSIVDPHKSLRQKTLANDTVRIPVFVVRKDLYEPNNTKSAVDAMATGGAFSSNLSVCQTTIDSLSIHREFIDDIECLGTKLPDIDYFKIYLTQPADSNHKVRISFSDLSETAFQDGNLDMELRSSNDSLLVLADDNDNDEEITLDGRTAGTYYVRVYGRDVQVDPLIELWNSNYYYKLDLVLPLPDLDCGDVNGNGLVNGQDVLMLASYLQGNLTVACLKQANVHSDSCAINGLDLTTLSNYVFGGIQLPPNACSCP